MPIEEESPEEHGYGNIKNNLSESSVADLTLAEALPPERPAADLASLQLLYTVHQGDPRLRRAICDQLYATSAGDRPDPEHVLVVPGAAAALFMVHTAMLGGRRSGGGGGGGGDDHIVVHQPNYGVNIETPLRALGAAVDFVRVEFDRGFRTTWQEFASRVRADGSTKLLSLTSPHNPSGVVQEGLLEGIVQHVLPQHPNLVVISDETYRFFGDLQIVVPPDSSAAAAAAAPPPPVPSYVGHPRVLRIGSLSKALGLPGLRIGWVVCPCPALRRRLIAAKEQIFITNSVLDEEVALRCIARDESGDTTTSADAAAARSHLLRNVVPLIRSRVAPNYQVIKEWMAANKDVLEWVDPQGGAVVCFARLAGFGEYERAVAAAGTDAAALSAAELKRPPLDVALFHDVLLKKHATYVGPGRWFLRPDWYMRIGFGYPPTEQLRAGLEAIRAAAAEARVA